MARRRSGNQLAFNDMLFNVLLGFVVLFVIAFLLINPITKKQDVPSKAEAMIVLEWKNDSYSDIDLWLQRDDNSPVGFNNKSGQGMNLERDDLGSSNDRVFIDGVVTIIKKNREVINIRGVVPGNYYPNVHAYNWSETEPLTVKLTVIDVNPVYREIYTIEVVLTQRGDIARLPGFTIDKEGNVGGVFNHTKIIVPSRRSQGASN
jgi:hypothetical protein